MRGNAMIGEASKRRPRTRCIFVPSVAVPLLLMLLMLVTPTSKAFLSTVHLGRTLKSLRARHQERQVLLQQEHDLQQQQQKEFELLPPGLPASPNSELAAEEEGSDLEAQADQDPEHEAVEGGDEATAVGGTHPSWGGSPDADVKDKPEAGGQATPAAVGEESRGWWHRKGDGDTDERVKETTASAAGAGGQDAGDDADVDDVDVSRERRHGVLKEHSAADRGDRSKLSTATAAAAAATAAAVDLGRLATTASHDTDTAAPHVTQQQEEEEEVPEEDMTAGHSMLRHEEDASLVDDKGVGAAAGAVEAALGSSATPDAKHEAVSEDSSEDGFDGLDDPAATEEASPAAVSEQGTEVEEYEQLLFESSEEEEMMLGGEEQEESESEGQQQQEEEEMLAYDEEVEAAAVQRILGLRADKDRAVQDAAARAVEALPPTQRECFEDVKAFAFGGEAEGGLSDEDVAALETVAICGDRDGVVLAFLRHSKFDVRKAKESMQRCCAWRKDNKADDIFQRAVSPAKMRNHREYWPTGFHKKDRLGRPVFYDRVGQSDLSKLRAGSDGLDQDEMVQIFTQNMEARRRFVLTRLSREAGHPVDQMTTVLDLTGLGVRHMSKEAISYTRRISEVFQDNYSGMTCSLLILNAPWVFNKGWQIIESFLSEDTVAKVKVLGKGEAGLKELEKYIPKENIPEFMGGESPAVIGPSDPLWTEVDSAVQAWAEGVDPFLDPAEVKRVSRRIARERAALLSSSPKPQSDTKSKQISEEPVGIESELAAAAAAVERAVRGPQGTTELGGDNSSIEYEDDDDDDEVLVVVGGGSDDADDGAVARKKRAKKASTSSRRAAAAGAIGDEASSARRRTAADTGSSSSKPRRRRQQRRLDADEKVAEEQTGGTKKKHRRKRGPGSGIVSASGRAGRISSSSRRPSSASSLSSSFGDRLTKDVSDTITDVDAGNSGKAASPALGGSAAAGTTRSASARGAAKKRRDGKHARAKIPGKRGKEEEPAVVVAGEDRERAGGDDNEVGEGAMQQEEEEEEIAEGAIAARYVERFAEVLGPAFGPLLKQMVDGVMAAVRIMLSAVESALRFLRDLFFEQIEVDE